MKISTFILIILTSSLVAFNSQAVVDTKVPLNYANPISAIQSLSAGWDDLVQPLTNYLSENCTIDLSNIKNPKLSLALTDACLFPQLVRHKRYLHNLALNDNSSPISLVEDWDVQYLKGGAFYSNPFSTSELGGARLVLEWLATEVAIKKSLTQIRVLFSEYWSKTSADGHLYYLPKVRASLASYSKFIAFDEYWNQLKCPLGDRTCRDYKSHVAAIFNSQVKGQHEAISYLSEQMTLFSNSSDSWVKERWQSIQKLILSVEKLRESTQSAAEIYQQVLEKNSTSKPFLNLEEAITNLAAVGVSFDEDQSLAIAAFATFSESARIYKKRHHIKFSAQFAPEFTNEVMNSQEYMILTQNIKSEIHSMTNLMISFLDEEGEL